MSDDDNECTAEVIGTVGDMYARLEAEGHSRETLKAASRARYASGAKWCGWHGIHGFCEADADQMRSFLPAAEAEVLVVEAVDDDKCDAEAIGDGEALRDRLVAEGYSEDDVASAWPTFTGQDHRWCGDHGEFCTRDLDLLRSFLPAAEAGVEVAEGDDDTCGGLVMDASDAAIIARLVAEGHTEDQVRHALDAWTDDDDAPICDTHAFSFCEYDLDAIRAHLPAAESEPETPEPPLWERMWDHYGVRARCKACLHQVRAAGTLGLDSEPLAAIETTAHSLLSQMRQHEADAHGIEHPRPGKAWLRREVERLERALDAAQADRAAVEADRDEAEARAARLKAERDTARASRNAAQAARDEWRERAESAGAIIDKAQDERAAARQRADKAEAEVERLSDERDFWKSTAEAEVARLTALCDELNAAKEDAQRRAIRNASEAEDAYERATALADVGINLLRLLGGDA